MSTSLHVLLDLQIHDTAFVSSLKTAMTNAVAGDIVLIMSNGGFGGIHHFLRSKVAGFSIIDLLFGDRILFTQFPVACNVLLCFHQICFLHRQICQRLLISRIGLLRINRI